MNDVYINRGRHLPRRTLLRGAGVCLGLPLLDAMTPAFAAIEDAPFAKRFLGVSVSLGLHAPNLIPADSGSDYALSPYLSKADDLRQDFTIVSGSSHPDVGNGHSSSSSILTACPNGRSANRNTISIDQRMAGALGGHTRFPSLVLTTTQQSETSISCTENGAMIPAEGDPARLFAQLFLDPTPAEQTRQLELMRHGQSLMDAIRSDIKNLRGRLGAPDQTKLDDWVHSVRGLEKTLQANAAWIDRPKPQVD